MAGKNPSGGLLFLTARLLAVLFILLCWGILILGIIEYRNAAAAKPELFTLHGWTPGEMDVVMGQIGLSYQFWLQWDRYSSIVIAVFFSLVGIFLFLRKSGDWFGLYLAMTLVLYGTLNNSATNAVSTIYPKLEPLMAPIGDIAWLTLIIIMFLFPNGRFVPHWTRLVVLGIIIAFGIHIGFFGRNIPPYYYFPLISMIMIGPTSQVYRYRKVSNSLERQQTKLVMLSMVIVITLLLSIGIPYMIGLDLNPNTRLSLFFALLDVLGGYGVGLIPLSIALAVMRYRLWDIDIIIRRTLLYTGLTATLGLLYFGSVVLFQQVLGAITGNSTLAIVLSTLLIAAVFDSARRRIQNFVDRRFYRQKYNAALALEEFSDAARHEVALDHLTAQVVGVIEKTVQPERVSIWLRKERE